MNWTANEEGEVDPSSMRGRKAPVGQAHRTMTSSRLPGGFDNLVGKVVEHYGVEMEQSASR